MTNDMKLYYDYTVSPLGQVFYKTVWRQLETIKEKKVLDFGSGFGFTSNFFAKNNDVIAIEIDKTMIDACKGENPFHQINGDLCALQQFENESFDVVVCHLVFEFVDNPKEILSELVRVLKKDGIISIVRHNREGRIIQSVVQDYDLTETKKLLQGNPSYSSAFGNINYYKNDDLLAWANNTLKIENVYGLRALASLHNADVQSKENWVEDMLQIEWELLQQQSFIDIAYFNHLILKKH